MMAIKQCPVCLKRFEARRDKQTCSAACKKRLQRTPSKTEMLKQSYNEAISAARFLGAYMDDPELKARAHNSLKSLIRSMLEYMPDYERLALASELQQSVSSASYLNIRSQSGQMNVPFNQSTE